MTEPRSPAAVRAADVPPRARQSIYPQRFVHVTEGREKRALGDVFGLQRFGVNLTRLAPGASSALRHSHSQQDELVYVLEGEPTLITDAGEQRLGPGDCAGFRAGAPGGHHLVNRSDDDVVLIEIGDRTPGDEVTYPDDDLHGELTPDGARRFSHRDGTPY